MWSAENWNENFLIITRRWEIVAIFPFLYSRLKSVIIQTENQTIFYTFLFAKWKKKL